MIGRARALSLMLLAGLLASCGKKEKTSDTREPPAPTFEPPPPWLPLEGPPGGRSPCERGEAKNADEAARHCFSKRVKTALLAVAKTKRATEIEVGDRAHIERHLAYAPHVACTETATPGEEKPQWSAYPKRTVLGDPASVSTSRQYFHCSFTATAPNTPVDGSYYLGFYVDAQSLETVYVYHPMCC